MGWARSKTGHARNAAATTGGFHFGCAIIYKGSLYSSLAQSESVAASACRATPVRRHPAARPASTDRRPDLECPDLARQLPMPQDAEGRQELRLLSSARGRGERPRRDLAASLFAEGAARKSAAPRRRAHGHQGRHRGVAEWLKTQEDEREIAFRPARVLMQDFTGVPAVVDLAAMRDAMTAARRRSAKINPLVPVDLVIDHSVMVDDFGTPSAFANNVEQEYERNGERYAFLRWGAGAFDNFRVVPPGTGICHQVNLEYLSQTVWTRQDGDGGSTVAYPRYAGRHRQPHHHGQRPRRARLGRRRHRGRGRHARPADLHADPGGDRLPLDRQAEEGVTATDLVLTVTQMLRKRGRRRQVRRVLRRRPRQPAARGPRHHRQHGAGIRRDLRLLPDRRGDARLISTPPAARIRRIALVEAYAQGAGHVPRRRHRPTRCSPTRSRSISATSSRRWPGRSGRRTACRSTRAAGAFAEALDKEYGKADEKGKRVKVAGHQFRPRPRRRGDCRHHLLHQHLEPVA